MPIRPARWSDIGAISSVMAASFAPDRLFRALYPHQAEHPDDFLRACRQQMRESWWDWKKLIMLSYEIVGKEGENGETTPLLQGEAGDERRGKEAGRSGREVVTGVAVWERGGEGWKDVWGVGGWWDVRLYTLPFVKVFHRMYNILIPNRSEPRPTLANPNPLTWHQFFPQLVPFIAHLYEVPHRQNHWMLEVLAVSPEYQGKGFGRELVERGLERARKEALPSGVMAADGKEDWYRRRGFKELAGWTSREGGDQNPMALIGVGGGALLWTW